MATRILLFGLIIASFSSCATYRAGQTPDDVYYSPAREVSDYVQVDRSEDNRLSYNENNLEDLRLRQQIRDNRFRFDDYYYWNTPVYNSWGWNTWNNPYNTWGWNNNYGYSYYGGYNKGWNSNYVFIPGCNNMIIIPDPGAPKNSTGIRYTPTITRYTNAGSNYNGKTAAGSSTRYFPNSSNTGGSTRRSGFFGGGGNTNSPNYNSGNSNRSFGNSNSSSSSGGSRTFSNSGSSSSSSSSSSKSTGTRRN